MEGWKDYINRHKKIAYIIGLLFAVFFGGCTFPAINFTHRIQLTVAFVNIWAVIWVYVCIGQFEAVVFENSSLVKIIFLNLEIVGLGMLCRYLLEFGEVSNTYNFTLLNSAYHIFFTVLLATVNWYKGVKKKNGEQKI